VILDFVFIDPKHSGISSVQWASVCANIFPQCGALKFADGKISGVGVCVGDCFFSPNDISGLRRAKKIIWDKGGIWYEDDEQT